MEVLFSQWVVYDHPSDYPENFVVRRWEIFNQRPYFRPTGDVVLATTIEEARRSIPWDRIRFSRSPEDDPKIVEIWM
jgi:hypothetical protein